MNLEFVRITSPEIIQFIPRHLFEQITGRSWTVDRIIKMGASFLVSGGNCFWALVNDETQIKGFLWAVIDVLSEKLNVIAFTVDKDCADESDNDMAIKFLREWIKEFNAVESDTKLKPKINWVTDRPEMFKGHTKPTTTMIEV